MRRFFPIFLMAALLSVGCGAPDKATGSDASASRTASPPAMSPSPQAVLQPGNCYGSSSSFNSTKTKALGMDSVTLTVPAGWSDQTSQVTGEAGLLRVQAPASYGSDNASFMLVAIPGPRPGSSAREQAIEDAIGVASLAPSSV